MKTSGLAFGLVLAASLVAVTTASAQTRSGSRLGAYGRGYSWSSTRTGNTVSGGVQTSGGYGATVTHTGGVNAYGTRSGSTTVTTNNGTTITTRAAGKNGYAGGSVAVTGPNGGTAYRAGAVYAPAY